MSTRTFTHRDFSGQLDVVTDVHQRAFNATLADLRAQDELTQAFRAVLDLGVPVDQLSAATGIAPDKIRTIADRNLTFGEDLAALSGISR